MAELIVPFKDVQMFSGNQWKEELRERMLKAGFNLKKSIIARPDSKKMQTIYSQK